MPSNQRAENGGLDSSRLDFAFLGRPDLQSKGPKILFFGLNIQKYPQYCWEFHDEL